MHMPSMHTSCTPPPMHAHPMHVHSPCVRSPCAHVHRLVGHRGEVALPSSVAVRGSRQIARRRAVTLRRRAVNAHHLAMIVRIHTANDASGSKRADRSRSLSFVRSFPTASAERALPLRSEGRWESGRKSLYIQLKLIHTWGLQRLSPHSRLTSEECT
jgi:hypothetical protein